MPPQVRVDIRHTMPGRLRLGLPRLRYDEPFTLRLQGLLEENPAIATVRFNRSAGCAVLGYQPRLWQPKDILASVQAAAGQAAHPELTPQITCRFDVFVTQGLSSYEFMQVQAIKNAWLTVPSGVFVWLARVLNIVAAVGDHLLPPSLFSKIITTHDQVCGRWQENWQTLQVHAGQMQCRDMQQAPLEVCDRLADHVRRASWLRSSGAGAFLGMLGPVGLIGSIPFSIVQALKIIHLTGLCYGYPPDNERERLFSLAVLAAATAHTPEDHQEALANLRRLHRDISARAAQEIITDAELAEITGETKEAVIGLALTSCSETLAVFALPVVGMVLGAVGLRTFLANIAAVAQRAYQMRWLLQRGRVTMITAAPRPTAVNRSVEAAGDARRRLIAGGPVG